MNDTKESIVKARHDLMFEVLADTCTGLVITTDELHDYAYEQYQGNNADSYQFAEEKIKQNVLLIKREAERLVDIINTLADVKF